MDDTTILGLITNNDETTERRSGTWQHGARATTSLNICKSKEIIVDFRKRQGGSS